jgi:hypothetical protein
MQQGLEDYIKSSSPVRYLFCTPWLLAHRDHISANFRASPETFVGHADGLYHLQGGLRTTSPDRVVRI